MYEIAGRTFEEADGRAYQNALADAYAGRVRPLCRCRTPGIEMYIAKLGESYLVKRMPGTGDRHQARCVSYEPPASLSGLGELLGTAIQANPNDGTVSLRLDFALTRKGQRSAGAGAGAASDHASVRSEPAKLSLRGILHYLFDQSRLTHWSPAMAGKRNWWVVRKHLLLAAEGKVTKGAGLRDRLFIPEPFTLDRKVDIARRRQGVFGPLAIADKGAYPLMLLIAEVKELGRGRSGGRLLIKHMPESPFSLSEVLYGRVTRRFAREIDLWNAVESSHLIVAAVFGVSAAGTASVEELSLMNVDERWLPFDDMSEKDLLDAAVQQGRRFVKSLRYNAAASVVMPALVLSDVQETIPLYILPPGAAEDYSRKVAENANGLATWQWDSTTVMPDLPK